jgi:hypothetical protein
MALTATEGEDEEEETLFFMVKRVIYIYSGVMKRNFSSANAKTGNYSLTQKGKVFLVLNQFSKMPCRRMGEWRYGCINPDLGPRWR